MNITQLQNRLPKNIVGIFVIIPNDGRCAISGSERRLQSYSNGVAFVNDLHNESKIVAIYAKDILDWEVSPKTKMWIKEGDEVCVDVCGSPKKGIVDYVKEGDGSPYPYIVKFNDRENGQFKRSELEIVSKAGFFKLKGKK